MDRTPPDPLPAAPPGPLPPPELPPPELLLPELPPGDSELYSHPALDEFPHEAAALVSPRVRAEVARLGIRLVRYQDL